MTDFPPPIDARVPYDRTDSIHSLLYSRALREHRDLEKMLDTFNELDGARVPEFQDRFYREFGIDEEVGADGPLLILETQRKVSIKAMRAAVQYYELYREEIQTYAHYINDRADLDNE